MATAVELSNVASLITLAAGAPANVAAFGGRQFYQDSTTNELYMLNGSTIVKAGASGTSTPTNPSKTWRFLVIGSSVRQGSGPGEPSYVSTRGPIYLAAQADGVTLVPVGFRNDATRQGTPGAHSAQGGMKMLVTGGNGEYSGLELVSRSKAAVPDGEDLLITVEGGLNDFQGFNVGYDKFCTDALQYARFVRSNYPLARIVLEGIGASTWIPANLLAQYKTQVKDVFVAENPKNYAVDTYSYKANPLPAGDFTDGTHPTLTGAIDQGNDLWRQIKALDFMTSTPTNPTTGINSVAQILRDMTDWSDGTAGGTVNPLYAPLQNFLIGCCVRNTGLPATSKPAFVIQGSEANFNNCPDWVLNGSCTWSGYRNMNWLYWFLWSVIFEGKGNTSNNVGLEIRRVRQRYRRRSDKSWQNAFTANSMNWFTVEPSGLVWQDPQGRIDTRLSAEGNQILRLWRKDAGGGDNCYHATCGSSAGGVTSNGSYNATAIYNAGLDAVWSKVDYRLVPWDTSQPLGNAEWYGYTGLDFYPVVGSPYRGGCGVSGRFDPPASGSGRMTRLTSAWAPSQYASLRAARVEAQDVTKCSITTADFQAFPPSAAMLAD